MNYLVRLADFSWQKVFLIALGLCAAYYFTQFDDGSALDAMLLDSQGALAEKRANLASVEKKMKEMEKFKEDLNSQQAQFKEVMSFLPPQMNISELVSTVQERASQAQMKVMRTEPKDETIRIEFYEAMKVEIQLQGTYSQAAVFLSLLSKLPRLVTIEKIAMRNLGGDSETPKVDFSATLLGYQSVEQSKPPADPNQQGANPDGV